LTFTALENLHDDDDVIISGIWEDVAENVKASTTWSLGCYELKQHKAWFEEKCSKLLDRRKQGKFYRMCNQEVSHFIEFSGTKRGNELKKKMNELKKYKKHQRFI
jgi:hypothetical protein